MAMRNWLDRYEERDWETTRDGTVRYALTRLDEIGVIESQYLLSDPQTCKYLLTTDAPQSGERLD
jgi:hypothetical protein